MPKVFTPFTTEPLEVDEDEAAALKRAGLLRDKPPAPPEVPPMVKVRTVFGTEAAVPADEAESMRRGGLLLEDKPVPAAPKPPAPPAVPPAATPPAP